MFYACLYMLTNLEKLCNILSYVWSCVSLTPRTLINHLFVIFQVWTSTWNWFSSSFGFQVSGSILWLLRFLFCSILTFSCKMIMERCKKMFLVCSAQLSSVIYRISKFNGVKNPENEDFSPVINPSLLKIKCGNLPANLPQSSGSTWKIYFWFCFERLEEVGIWNANDGMSFK